MSVGTTLCIHGKSWSYPVTVKKKSLELWCNLQILLISITSELWYTSLTCLTQIALITAPVWKAFYLLWGAFQWILFIWVPTTMLWCNVYYPQVVDEQSVATMVSCPMNLWFKTKPTPGFALLTLCQMNHTFLARNYLRFKSLIILFKLFKEWGATIINCRNTFLPLDQGLFPIFYPCQLRKPTGLEKGRGWWGSQFRYWGL